MKNDTVSKTIASSGSLFIVVLDILGAIFVALKLTGYIGWSWWWVMSPYWIEFIIALNHYLLMGLENHGKETQ